MRWARRSDPIGRVGPQAVAVGSLAILLLAGVLPAAGTATFPGSPLGPKLTKLGDDANLSIPAGNGTSTIFDTVSPTVFGIDGIRSFWVNLTTTDPVPSQFVALQTVPSSDWAGAAQFPYGADNLPPLADWSWWVTGSFGSNDTGNWSVDPDGIHLDRTTPWANASFEIQGVSAPQVVVQVDPGAARGLSATGTGFVMNAPGYVNSLPSDPNYANLTGSIHPALIRLSLGVGGQITGWNSTTGHATFDFSGLDAEFRVAEATGAAVLLSLPAGTFGDGNSLPNGTPLNLSVRVDLKSSSGYFPTPAAYASIVRSVANHTYALGEAVGYWSIGNEVVLNSTPEVDAFATVINAAIGALAPHYPDARVGTDDMMDPRYLPEFANLTPGVGFLSLHRYPSQGLCLTPNGSYCPPAGGGLGSPTPDLFSRPAFQSGTTDHLLPTVAARDWYNRTGRWLPVLVTEMNLGYVGGPGGPNQALGTDPRTQTLVGAAWLGAFLIACSANNVSALTFFAFTSGTNLSGTLTYPYGGFGFGLTNESANGTVIRYAPYWAMRLWGSLLPPGSSAVSVHVADNRTVDAWAVRSGVNVDVALVNQVDANTTVHLQIAGNYSLNSTDLLDGTTYREPYDPSTRSTAVERSGIRTVVAPASSALTLHGYGMAVMVFTPANNTTNTSGSGGSGNGGGSYGGSGNGGGHGSGNGSGGNGTGSGASNNSGNRSSNGPGNGSANASGTGASNGTGPNQSSGPAPPNGNAPPGTGGSGGTPSPSGNPPPTAASALGGTASRFARVPGDLALGGLAFVGILGAGAGAVIAARSTRRTPRSESSR